MSTTPGSHCHLGRDFPRTAVHASGLLSGSLEGLGQEPGPGTVQEKDPEAPFMKSTHRRPGVPRQRCSLTQGPLEWREKHQNQLPNDALELSLRLKAPWISLHFVGLSSPPNCH